MNQKNSVRRIVSFVVSVCIVLLTVPFTSNVAADLAEVKERGVLRHLGVPYANFVTGSGDGIDVELVQLFAEHLGVKYEYVPTSWGEVIGDLTGKQVKARGDEIEILGDVPVKGDIIANGLTMLPWRQKIVDYSLPTFPTQVWLIARGDSSLLPITPSEDVQQDITTVKALLQDHAVLGITNTCTDPSLYRFETTTQPVLFAGLLNELVPAIMHNEAETTLLDVPDALMALQKWPGKIKVIGPVSPPQEMGCGFAKSSPELRDAFNRFFEQCQQDGTYLRLVKKYYPTVFNYYSEFFKDAK